MSPIEPLALELLSGAAVNVVRTFLERRGGTATNTESVELPLDVVEALQTQVDGLEPPEEGAIGRSRHVARRPIEPSQASAKDLPPAVGGAALSIAPGEIFRDARAQNKRVFLVNLILGIAFATLLFVAIAGALLSSLVLHAPVAAATFAGVSILDLFGFAFTKPFTVIQQSSVASQRLDLAHLRLQEQLRDCDHHQDPVAKFECRSQVWDTIQAELRSLVEPIGSKEFA